MAEPEVKTGTVKLVKYDDVLGQYRGVVESLDRELPFTIDPKKQHPLESIPVEGETVQFEVNTDGFVDRAEDVRSIWSKYEPGE